MRFEPLPRTFYRPSAAIVAPQLLGHWLVRNAPDGPCGGPIVEVEAYLCQNDPACHSAIGETERNRSMWGRHGRSYVYLIYGYHFCVNAVCMPPGSAEAVLIRAVEPLFGEDLMRKRRTVNSAPDLTNGPAKLCAAMDIERAMDGADLCNVQSPLFIARNPTLELFRKERGPVTTTTRVGITKAAELPLRFYLDGSPCISKRERGSRLKMKSRV